MSKTNDAAVQMLERLRGRLAGLDRRARATVGLTSGGAILLVRLEHVPGSNHQCSIRWEDIADHTPDQLADLEERLFGQGRDALTKAKAGR